MTKSSDAFQYIVWNKFCKQQTTKYATLLFWSLLIYLMYFSNNTHRNSVIMLHSFPTTSIISLVINEMNTFQQSQWTSQQCNSADSNNLGYIGVIATSEYNLAGWIHTVRNVKLFPEMDNEQNCSKAHEDLFCALKWHNLVFPKWIFQILLKY